ncbi:MAG: hypothetical protein ABSH11_14095 [Verrucomicrobiota bacterium]|jgi:hypothetical protein
MRTKTLLIASAALAAGILACSAQTYSQNVVGYANIQTLTGGNQYMLACPFAIGSSNGANEIFGLNLPSGSQIQTWDSGSSTFSTVIFDTSDPQGLGSDAPVWYTDNDWDAATIPTLPPGQGFFLTPNGPVTNTFAGAVAVAVGTSNQMVLPTGGNSYMVGSVVPYAGDVTNGTASTGGPNLNGLPSGSQIQTWNSGSSAYTTIIYDTSDPQGLGTDAPVWYQDNDWDGAPCPSVTVGQAFFIIPNAPYTWTTGL